VHGRPGHVGGGTGASARELIALRALGASINDLTLWLRQQRRVVVHRSSVVRALRRWAGEPRA
jgi:hypothetical protein